MTIEEADRQETDQRHAAKMVEVRKRADSLRAALIRNTVAEEAGGEGEEGAGEVGGVEGEGEIAALEKEIADLEGETSSP